MPDSFDLKIPGTDGQERAHTLRLGEILFILGANGAGKSSLISRFFNTHHESAKRIAAHRQTWIHSNALDVTPKTRDDFETIVQRYDRQAEARYQEEYANQRAGFAIYDLIDSDNMLNRDIVNSLREGDSEGAERKAKTPNQLQTINELMRLSNLPVEISVEDRQKLVARRNGGAPYSIAELSDGERNAFLIAANVLTAAPQSLILIDEPERHLHRAIISPLLTLLFERRRDCAFIISTHELMLPVDNPSSQALLLRSCDYQSFLARSWTADFWAPDVPLDEELKRDILGSRNKILFVEGTVQSLDLPLYSLLFPQVSIIPKSNCREVENAVRGLRDTADRHWISTWGIVDNDRRSSEDVARLRTLGVHALSHFSVESLYFHPEMIRRVTKRQVEVTGRDANAVYEQAIAEGLEAIRNQKDHLVHNVVERLVRQEIFRKLPTKQDLRDRAEFDLRVDIADLRAMEEQKFDQLVSAKNLDGLLRRYPVRESGALKGIVSAIGVSRSDYEAAVRKLLQEEAEALAFLRNLFGTLFAEVHA